MAKSKVNVSRIIENASAVNAGDDKGHSQEHNAEQWERTPAPVVPWSRVILWKDGNDGRRYKVRSQTELASALSEFRDSRTLPPGYHFNGWRMIFTTEKLHELPSDHVYIHAFSVKWNLLSDDGSVSAVYDVREVAAIAAYIESNNGRLPKGVQPWPYKVNWEGIDAAAKGATATMEQIQNVKGRLRFSVDD